MGTSGNNRDGPGRWPANVVTDGSDEVLEAFAVFGESTSSDRPRKNGNFASVAEGRDKAHVTHGHADTSTAARFFYGSKAGARDRVIHCTACGARASATDRDAHRHGRGDFAHLRSHPTVKSQALMAYLCKLACPPGGTVLEPFAGSGSTGQAALTAGFAALLIEREADYVADIEFRLGLSCPIAGDWGRKRVSGDVLADPRGKHGSMRTGTCFRAWPPPPP